MKNMILIALAISCMALVPRKTQAQTPKSGELSDTEMSALMMTCYVCHNPKVKSHDDAIAPPLVAVKYRYKQQYSSKEAFIEAAFNFIMEPTADKAIMRGPVKKFGPMPQMPLDPVQVKAILNYLYDHQIMEPEWFPAHFKEQHGKEWKGQ